MAAPPKGTVTFLFTDIQGSTKSWQQQPQAMAAALARHDAILRGAIETQNGYVYKTVGDAFYAAFSTGLAGVTAAVNAQFALRAETWPPEIGHVKVRMAMHTGAPELRDGEYFGTPVNRVSKLLGIGYGEQVLLSIATAELVRDVLPPEWKLRDMGIHRLKDFPLPEHVIQLDVPDLPGTFPPLLSVSLTDMEEQEWVVGVVVGGQARAYRLSTIQRMDILSDELGGSPIVLISDQNGRANAFRRQSGGRMITIVADPSDPRYVTNAERTIWWDRAGRVVTTLRGATAGPLERLEATRQWWSQWRDHYPNTTVYVE